MIGRVLDLAKTPVVTLKVLTESGVIRPHSPVTLGGVALALQQWGMGVAGGFKAVALRFPDRVGVIDELGELTFAEIERRSNALADSLAQLGVGEGDGVAILIRNHRGFLDASLAAAKLGADMLYLNTAFAAPQLGEVCEREKPSVVIHDQEFTELIDKAGVEQQRILAWVDDDAGDLDTLEALIEKGDPKPRTAPAREARAVILTSGTTGTPKGAPRGGGNLSAAVALLSRMPLKSGWKTHIAAPLFHTWGWAHLSMAMLLGSTSVLTRTFDPETQPEDRAGQPLRGARGDPGDAAADAQAAAGDPRLLRPVVAPGGGRVRARRWPAAWPSTGWTSTATTSTTSTARPRSPGPRSRSPRTCAPHPTPQASRR